MSIIYQPTLVIGLGGTGKSILLELKKMILENSPQGMADFPFLRLLSIDTDKNVNNTSSNIDTVEDRDLILDRHKETFSLGTDFISPPNLSDFPEIEEWFPQSYRHLLLPAELERGAAQKKPVGRFSFAWNASSLLPQLTNILSNIVDTRTMRERGITIDNDYINTFICGSLCGGTGAGTFLDTAYMIRYISRRMINKNIYIYGILALSSIFQGIQGDIQLKPNCYASLMELDHFTNKFTFDNAYQRFRPSYKNFAHLYEEASAVYPYDFPFLFDKNNDRGLAFNSISAFSEMSARFIYLLTGHTVSKQYSQMDSNVSGAVEQDYKAIYNKPCKYRSMGTFSIVFPKRMAIQLCGYLLADKYFDFMLTDDYKDYEIEKYTKKFLADYKLGLDNNQIETHFDNYKLNDDSERKFSDYIRNTINNFEDNLTTNKKEVIAELKNFFEDLEKILEEYKSQNLSSAKKLKDAFISYVNSHFEEILDLKKTEDAINEKLIRGSVRRAEKFIKQLLDFFEDAESKYKKEEDNFGSEVENHKSNFEAIINSDLSQAIESLLPSKKKIQQLTSDALNSLYEYAESIRKQFTYSHIVQFITDILDKRGSISETGIRDFLEEKLKFARKMVNDYENVSKKIKETINDNKNYDEGNFCETIFDYKEDVENVLSGLLEEKGEDFIYESLSDNLRSDKVFGSQYEKIEFYGSSTILRYLLKETEKFFYEPINEINIEDKIVNNGKLRSNFENAVYINTAGVFVGLDGNELAKTGLESSLSKGRFFAITIPDTYNGKPCDETQGQLSTQAGKRLCPIDQNPDKYKDNICPKYDKCLKQILLKNAPQNLAIIPCDDKSEVNIIQTIATYPVHALTTARSAKTDYFQLKQKFDAESKERGILEEKVNMFGPISIPDLFEKTEDIRRQIDDFKTSLLVSYSVNWLDIQKLDISFFTEEDFEFQRDKPSLRLGKNLEEVINKMQSNALDDIKIISDFNNMYNFRIDALIDKGKADKLYDKIKSLYDAMMKDKGGIPDGFERRDAELLNEFCISKFKKGLKQRLKQGGEDGSWGL